MAERAASRADKIASLYARGVLTRQETLVEFVLMVAEETPASLAIVLSDDLINEIQELCRRPPVDPSGSPIIFGIGVSDPAAWRQWTSQAWYDGAWCWYRYFEA